MSHFHERYSHPKYGTGWSTNRLATRLCQWDTREQWETDNRTSPASAWQNEAVECNGEHCAAYPDQKKART